MSIAFQAQQTTNQFMVNATGVNGDTPSLRQRLKDYFTLPDRNPNETKQSFGQRFMNFLSKLSRGIMTVVAVMPVMGLFLGIGAAIMTNSTPGTAIYVFGQFLNTTGSALFSNLGFFFCIALAAAFAQGSTAYGAFCGAIAYAAFAYGQTAFIQPSSNGSADYYDILFWRNVPASAVEATFTGAKALTTSVFGSCCVGVFTGFIYNRTRKTQLPMLFSFFGGERFSSLLSIFGGLMWSFVFLIYWPPINMGLAAFGTASAGWYGADSLIFGYVERALIPFGLHHAFYATLWWTAAGGEVKDTYYVSLFRNGDHNLPFSGSILDYVHQVDPSYVWNSSDWQGDQKLWLTFQRFGIPYDNSTAYATQVWTDATHANEVKLNLGRFMQGKYCFMMFGYCFGAGLAMIWAAAKTNRKEAIGVIGSAMITMLMTGVTEPMDFSFVFLSPFLYWCVNCVLAALCFMCMNFAHSHIGMTFSGGVIDYIIYGIIPVKLGTQFWWAIPIGLASFPIYFFIFYFWIKKHNIMTPGRDPQSGVAFVSKEAVKSQLFGVTDKNKPATSPAQPSPTPVDPNNKEAVIVFSLGGRENIVSVDACATRLRVIVKDTTKIKPDGFKATGAFGQRVTGKEIQVIYGPTASTVKARVEDFLNTNK